MRTIDADRLLEEKRIHTYYHLPNGDIAIPLIDIKNAPTIEPRKKGMWIEHNPHKWGLGIVFECSECGEKIDCEPSNFCPNCGSDMRTPVETARDIVHKAIDNSVWSDIVDTAEMHKVVDDWCAENGGRCEC